MISLLEASEHLLFTLRHSPTAYAQSRALMQEVENAIIIAEKRYLHEREIYGNAESLPSNR